MRPPPPAASRATACAPIRCRSRSSASAPSRSWRTWLASLARHTESIAGHSLDDHVNIKSRQLFGKGGTAFRLSFGRAWLCHEVPAIHVAEIAQSAQERRDTLIPRVGPLGVGGSVCGYNDSDPIDLPGLRLPLQGYADLVGRPEADPRRAGTETSRRRRCATPFQFGAEPQRQAAQARG